MSKTKTFGPANDLYVPYEEMAIAKLVQNAKANNLKWTKGAIYRDRHGKPLMTGSKAASCCAIGAANLTWDTTNININPYGNDEGYEYKHFGQLKNEDTTPFQIGLGFRMAMK